MEKFIIKHIHNDKMEKYLIWEYVCGRNWIYETDNIEDATVFEEEHVLKYIIGHALNKYNDNKFNYVIIRI